MTTGYPATVYYDNSGAYFVKDNVTKEIVQVSDKRNPCWIPDPGIIDPLKPTAIKTIKPATSETIDTVVPEGSTLPDFIIE